MLYITDVIKTGLKLILGRGSVRSFSQFGEDAVLASVFRNKKKGTYVDVGAFHPTQYSNTYLFYRRGWKGIAIDPNPRAKVLFRIFRPRDFFCRAAVGKKKENAPYFMFADSAYNRLDKSHMQRGEKPVEERSVPVRPLRDIVSERGLSSIDVLSVDVEGRDLEVLKSHDWNIPPQVVVAEDHHFDIENPKRSDIYRFLMEKNYTLLAVCGPSLLFKNQKAVK